MKLKEKADYKVYKHTAPNGKIYIGITRLAPEKRWLNGRGYARNQHFYKAIKKYGWDNFTHEIVATFETASEACAEEQRLIQLYDTTNPEKGYNGTSGGEHYEHTPETKEKLRQAHLGNSYNKGVPFTEERKRHLSEHHADVRGEKNPNYGKKKPPEEIARRLAHREYKKGSDHPAAKPILQFTKDGIFVKRWGSIAEAADQYCRTCIKDCLKGKYKVGNGFVWKYESEVNNAIPTE